MKKKFYRFVLNKILGWRIMMSLPSMLVEFYELNRLNGNSVVLVAPHTSFRDGFIGKIAMGALGVNYITLSASWLFFFPFKYVMKYALNAIPVGTSLNTIRLSAKQLQENEKMHIVLCPEGHLKAVDKWSLGFYYIAKKANVGVDLFSLDYNTKKIIYEKHIPSYEIQEKKPIEIMEMVTEAYKIAKDNNYAKYPEKFELHKI